MFRLFTSACCAPPHPALLVFLYKREDAEALPTWLTRDANFVGVVPDSLIQPASSDPAGPAEEAQNSDSFETKPATEAVPEPILDAAAVLDALVAALELKAPKLTSDPLGFFVEQLRSALLGEQQNPMMDVYAIHRVIQRIEESRHRESQLANPIHADGLMEDVRNAVRAADSRRAIQIARSIPMDELTPALIRELRSTVAEATQLLDGYSDDQMLG
jgi:hypothetical protein